MEAFAGLAEKIFDAIGPWAFLLTIAGCAGLWFGSKVILAMFNRLHSLQEEHARQREQLVREGDERVRVARAAHIAEIEALRRRVDDAVAGFMERDNQKRDDFRAVFAKVDKIFEETMETLREHTQALHQINLSIASRGNRR